ncbi:phosphoglucosamine mutase [Halothece sp. PCC 7418]|uniref:phosphoglucosamine mutase n=1 Tax=Halothece sp. (strain PCC 7418) TaxID=65093 RepID=UPI0002A08166|nr:phosphoglucosamine mutase [Halothece sp. PCC 7418]AFZ43695.1 phosphoglucosamine mutase [Halothece sp. PCC 7418]
MVVATANNAFLNLPELPKSKLFGTDGIRGQAGHLLTAPLALAVGFWAGQIYKEQSGVGAIAIGQDSRNSSDMLAMSLTAGLTAAGLEVWNLGLCPTPCVAYLTANTEAIGGIMISASHNPPEDNGIKLFTAKGTKIGKAEASAIEAGVRGNRDIFLSDVNWGQHYPRQGLVQQYTTALEESLPRDRPLAGLKIVLDLAWGASVKVAPTLFQSLGAEVIAIHESPNGDRINVDCGSTNLHSLQKTVCETQADLGFAFDGDADRVLAVDSQGRIVDGDYILYFWGKLLKNKAKLPNNLLIATVMANLGFERAWEDIGGRLIRTAVGDQHVQAQMWETGAMLGGEQSGHVICHHYSCSGDGVQTALHLACLTRQLGLSLWEMRDESFETYPQLLKNVRVADAEKRCAWAECDPLQSAIAQAEQAMGDQGRVLVRASGTEPVIRVMVEASQLETAHHWSNYLVDQVQEHLA